MKKLLAVATALSLALPMVASAAFNDVTLTNGGAILSIGGIEVDVAAANTVITSIAAGASSFTVVIEPGASLQLTAPSLNQMAVSLTSGASDYQETIICNGSLSQLQEVPGTATSTLTITPSATLCSTSSGSSSSGTSVAGTGSNGGPAGGGGGGGSYKPVSAPTIIPPTKNQTVADLQAQLGALNAKLAGLQGNASPNANAYANANANASFKRDLRTGSTGADVKTLQVWLNAHGYVVAKSGSGSSGNETTRFGAATRAALKAFQKAVGITPASGNFGPKTRAYITAHP